MIKNTLILGLCFIAASCGSSSENDLDDNMKADNEYSTVVDSLVYFKDQRIKTDYLSREFPDLDRETANLLQIKSLEKELEAGDVLAGWKMGGTVGDSSKFDPLMGYMLTKNEYKPGDKISIKKFPGAEVMIEGEVGFVFKKDLPEGVSSIEELKDAIDYAVGAVEFAQSNAIGLNGDAATVKTNHVLAFGTGQAGFMLGDKQIPMDEFGVEDETVECYIDGKTAAKGESTNIYNGHLNALYALANMLPEQGYKIRKGDVVITGSLYKNPTVKGQASAKLDFKTLGSIEFEITD